jgi:hypothetical protein
MDGIVDLSTVLFFAIELQFTRAGYSSSPLSRENVFATQL